MKVFYLTSVLDKRTRNAITSFLDVAKSSKKITQQTVHFVSSLRWRGNVRSGVP